MTKDQMEALQANEQTLAWLEKYKPTLADAQAEVARLREVHLHGCECSTDEACLFARQRDEARAMLFEVASAGIEHHTRDYVVLQLPRATWDALETLAQEPTP
jgi:hypothetical protein